MASSYTLELLDDSKRARNACKKCKPDFLRCVRCELPLDPARAVWFAFHHGDLTIVTLEERDRLNAAGSEGSDMGCHPLGPECAKQVPKKFHLDPEIQSRLRDTK